MESESRSAAWQRTWIMFPIKGIWPAVEYRGVMFCIEEKYIASAPLSRRRARERSNGGKLANKKLPPAGIEPASVA